jgi:hypothetical protein
MYVAGIVYANAEVPFAIDAMVFGVPGVPDSTGGIKEGTVGSQIKLGYGSIYMLSRYLLWNKATLEASLADYVRRFSM